MRCFPKLIAAVLLAALFAALVPATLAGTVTDTVNVQYFNKNTSGDGYYWNNRTETLTLENLHLKTGSAYGMRVPDGAVVELVGDNYISAATVALALEGDVTFKGTGTLTLEGGQYGLYDYATDSACVARFMAKSLTATGGEAAIRCDSAKFFAESGAKLTLRSDGLAVSGVVVKLIDCTADANASLAVSQLLVIQNADVTVAADKAALDCPRSLTLSNVKLEAGPSLASLAAAETYGGENAVRLTHTGRAGRTSILFGDSCPAFVDYILLGVVLLGAAAAIALPIRRQKKKDAAARAAYEALMNGTKK